MVQVYVISTYSLLLKSTPKQTMQTTGKKTHIPLVQSHSIFEFYTNTVCQTNILNLTESIVMKATYLVYCNMNNLG